MAGIVALLFCVVPVEEAVRERVDCLELNHRYDLDGSFVFDQQIFYLWCDVTERYQVLAWKMVKHESQLPYKDFRTGRWVSVFQDGDLLRVVEATEYRETFLQYDPELIEREYLPKEKRQELRKP